MDRALMPGKKPSSVPVAKMVKRSGDQRSSPPLEAKQRSGEGKLPEATTRSSLFSDPLQGEEALDDKAVMFRHKRLARLLALQGMVVLALVAVIILGAPIMQPVYVYKYRTFGVNPREAHLVPLMYPNMTNKAILSWAAASVTEVMTIGFGDFDTHLVSQKKKFTSAGWESFVDALIKGKIREKFKEKQLILTTVPSDMPVISFQGPDPEDNTSYLWVIQLPVIMTYATNNNVTNKSRSVIQLTIVRVPAKDSIEGVGIKLWQIGGE